MRIGYIFLILYKQPALLKAIVPKSPILRQYIDVFYVFNTDKTVKFSHLAFPHTNTAISFFKGVSITRNEFVITIESNSENNGHIEMLGKYTKPVVVHYEGGFEEIAIVFKALGANRFIQEDFHSVAPAFSQAYENTIWKKFAATLFDTENKIGAIEDFLLSQWREIPDLQKIEKALKCFGNKETDYSVAEVAEIAGYNLKSFQRHFTKHVGCSPAVYKRIARFRNSLNSKLFAKEFKSLTSITYENNYTDQSYFIREFNKLTNQNPGKFFRDISLADGEKIVWEIL